MKDHQGETTLSIFVPNLKILLAQAGTTVREPPAFFNPGGWFGTVGSLLTILLGEGTPVLGATLVVVIFGDTLAGVLRARILPDETMTGARFAGGLLGKFLLLMLIPAAKGMDVALNAMSINLDLAGLNLITGTMAGLIMHESASIWRNVVRVKGTFVGGETLRKVMTLFGPRDDGGEK